ncbi:MAG TPA: hypothetical protein VNO79_15950, partial [Actinomycetota bacterium]|nr:hypothetical protein [Actinomycetota bacterium]
AGRPTPRRPPPRGRPAVRRAARGRGDLTLAPQEGGRADVARLLEGEPAIALAMLRVLARRLAARE